MGKLSFVLCYPTPTFGSKSESKKHGLVTKSVLAPADDYEYDVRVQACAGTSSSSVIAHFCSNSACDTTFGEEESVELEMSDEDGGWTTTSFPLSFNPLAVRLEEVDETW